MLSICIPIYNYDVTTLVKHLHQQGAALNIDFEILLMDDASQQRYKAINRECYELQHVIAIELEQNVGRSRIRNLLAQKARYPWLIFMDCDSQCPDDHYLERYLKQAKDEGVVCGGRIYHDQPPADDTYLHWLFGTKREVKPSGTRARKPNHSFMTNNFMIAATIMKEIRFNESLIGYGHEDTLFGLDLLKNGIKIKHIDNPLIHVGLQDAAEFLAKTREGTRNLLKVYKITGRDKALPEMAKLLKIWLIIRNLGLCRITGFFLALPETMLLKNLKGKNPSILFLDLYKLGYICRQTIRFKNKY